MAAQNTDLLMEVGLPGSATTLAGAGYTAGNTSITVATTSNHPTATGYVFAMDRVEIVDGKEVRIDGTYCEFTGVKTSDTTIGNLVLSYGSPQNYPASPTSRVYIPVSSTRENKLVAWGIAQHKQNGTHANITADSITNAGNYVQPTGTFQPPTNSIQAQALSQSAILLGYSQITSPFTTSSSSPVQVSTLTATVTVPAGGRKVKISVYAPQIFNSTPNIFQLTLLEGPVSTGTQLQSALWNTTGNSSSTTAPANMSVIVSPTAGSKTYNLALNTLGGTTTFFAGSTAPAYLLVELI